MGIRVWSGENKTKNNEGNIYLRFQSCAYGEVEGSRRRMVTTAKKIVYAMIHFSNRRNSLFLLFSPKAWALERS